MGMEQLRRGGLRFKALCLAAVLAGVGSGVGAEEMQPWEHVLAQQLDLEQKCILQNTYNVQEFQLGNDMVLSGKAHCYDGREFDFSQKKNHMKFDLKACDPTVC